MKSSLSKTTMFIQTLHSDVPIQVLSKTGEDFVFTTDIELPIGVKLFLKDLIAIKKGEKKPLPFEVIQIERVGSGFKYCASFGKKHLNFSEWEILHKKKA